ncbi:unnamed protein product [Calicophoron daubneyi]|uniref:ABC transporter domain-containing protein n=1 Tax=Calicophoron daubneyi TaxID=300641 RepID=A0AAV2TWE3_CALDB
MKHHKRKLPPNKKELFYRHYKALVWKNLVISHRKPLFLLGEIVAPLLVPVILGILHALNPDEEFPECHFQEISLPSMGIITYMQSMLCNFLYACQPYNPPDLEVFMNFTEVVAFATKLWDQNLRPPKNNPRPFWFITQAWEKMIILWPILTKYWPKMFPRVESEYFTDLDDPRTFDLFGITLTSSELDWLGRASSKVCGQPKHKNDVGRLIQMVVSSTDTHTKGESLFSNKPKHFKQSSDNGTSEEQYAHLCSAITRLFTIDALKPFSSRLAFYFFGFVYYHPSNPITDEIVKRLSYHQRLLSSFKVIILHWIKYSRKPFVNPDPRITKAAPDFLDKMIEFDKWMVILYKILSCFNLEDRYYPVQDRVDFEYWLETFRTVVFPPAFAVQFDRIPNVPYVSGSTRGKDLLFEVTLRRVGDTRGYKVIDRFRVPGYRHSPFRHDMEFLTSGFIDLQEAITDAIIEVSTKQPEEAKRDPGKARNDFDRKLLPRQLKPFPTPCFIQRNFLISLQALIPQVLLFSWVFIAMITARFIVEEKERSLRKFTRFMGLSNTLHWSGWASQMIFLMLPTTACMTIILKYGSIIPLCNGFMLLLNLSVIAFTLLCSTFFRNANQAAIVTGVTYFIFFLPYRLIMVNEGVMTTTDMFIASLFSQSAFCLGISSIVRTEIQGFGTQWDDFWTPRHYTDVFSVGKALVMIWADTGLYLLLALYIEVAYAEDYEVSKKCYYPLTFEYWFGRNARKEVKKALEEETAADEESSLTENEVDEDKVGVAIHKISKYYQNNSQPALNNLSLNFYKNQITTVIAHNNNERSALVAILTGVENPSSGTVKINGYDLLSQQTSMQDCLGYCPKYNIAFDDLTVSENLQFYSSLKGVSKEDADEENDRLLYELGLSEKRNELSKSLSAGQKRKLSVAIAFLGNTSVAVLEEPTSEVDLGSKRSLWRLISRLKSDRTIIIITNHTDEADALGDRVVIISGGRLRLVGSGLFLKSHYGFGYSLVLQTQIIEDPHKASYNLEKLSSIIQSYLPGANMIDRSPTEILIRIPTDCITSGELVSFFRHTEKNNPNPPDFPHTLQTLGVIGYTLSDTSLEDIYLDSTKHCTYKENVLAAKEWKWRQTERMRKPNYGVTLVDTHNASGPHHDHSHSHKSPQLRRNTQPAACTTTNDDNNNRFLKPGNLQSIINRIHYYKQAGPLSIEECHSNSTKSYTHATLTKQWGAICTKRFRQFGRDKRGWVVAYLFPVILIIIAMLLVIVLKRPTYSPPMPVHHWWLANQPGDPVLHTFYEKSLLAYHYIRRNRTTFPHSNQMASLYDDAIKATYGFTGLRCLLDGQYHLIPSKFSKCSSKHKLKWEPAEELTADERALVRTSSAFKCVCKSGKYDCPGGKITRPDPPRAQLQTSDVIYNLTAFNVSDYLLETHDLFIGRRFGGISFRNRPCLGPTDEKDVLNYLNENAHHVFGALIKYEINATKDELLNDPFWEWLINITWLSLPPPHNLIIWFDNKGYAAATGYLNLLQNMQFRILARGNDKLDKTFDREQGYGVAVNNHPLETVSYQSLINDMMNEIPLIIFTILALSLIPAGFLSLLVEERACGSKQLQIISGLDIYVYWLSVYIFDIMSYCIPCGLCVLVYLAFRKCAYVGSDVIEPFVLLLFLFGLAVLPFSYVFSFFFGSSDTAFVLLAILHLFIGSATLMITTLLDILIISGDDLNYLRDALNSLFLIFPQYCLGRALYNLASRGYVTQYRQYDLFDESQYLNPFGRHVTGEKLCALGVLAVLYLLIVILLEAKFFRTTFIASFHKMFPKWAQKHRLRLEQKASELRASSQPRTKDGVQKERKRVLALKKMGKLHRETSVGAIGLTKFYGDKENPSVNGLSFAVNRAECFVLVGRDGSGKSTVIRLLVGSLEPTMGTSYVDGFDVNSNPKEAHRCLGYSPQESDGLPGRLTGRETLTHYARLRGLPESTIPNTVDNLLKDMHLDAYADKDCSEYADGDRRKLSMAIALVGDPTVIFLDEPTRGLDPKSKRIVWDQISKAVKDGKSVVLTTNNMEECEALSNRLGIMDNGQLRFFGSIQQLRRSHGGGYTAEISLHKSEDGRIVRDQIEGKFNGAVSKHLGGLRYEYQFTPQTKLSEVLRALNQLHSDSLVKYYSVKQTSLDQVFIDLTQPRTEEISMNEVRRV